MKRKGRGSNARYLTSFSMELEGHGGGNLNFDTQEG